MMRWLAFAFAMLLCAASASAQSISNSPTQETSLITVTIPANQPVGEMNGYVNGCATGRVVWQPGALAGVDVYGTDSAGGGYSAGQVVKSLTAQVAEPGEAFFASSRYLRFYVNVQSAEASTIVMRCSNYFAESFSQAARALARVSQEGFTQTVNLSSSGTYCPGACTYLWQQTGGTACAPGIADPAAPNTTAADCPYDELLTFQLTADNEFGPPSIDTDTVTLSDVATGFPFNFPVLLQ